MSLRRFVALLSVIFFVGVASAACGPEYPNCDTDEHCADSEEGQSEGNLYCVNGLCQQCAEDAHCAEGQECAGGECRDIPGWCDSDDDCEGDRVCRDNSCGPECRDDNDCGDGEICEGGSCTEDTAECTIDDDCPGEQVCENEECVEPTADCDLETIYFPYDSSRLTSSARSTLEANAECLEQRDAGVQIEGHADERGTTEYNIALGERRAGSVADYLESLGVSSSRISTTSYGDQRLARSCGLDGSDSCHEANRRVVFNLR